MRGVGWEPVGRKEAGGGLATHTPSSAGSWGHRRPLGAITAGQCCHHLRLCPSRLGAPHSCGAAWCLCRTYRNRGGGAGQRLAGLPAVPGERLASSPCAWLCVMGRGCDPVGDPTSCPQCSWGQLQPHSHPAGLDPHWTSPRTHLGVRVLGATTQLGAGPLWVTGPVPARGRRGRSNGPLFPAGTQRAPVGRAGAGSRGWRGLAVWGGCDTCPESRSVPWGRPGVGAETAELGTSRHGKPRAGGAHPLGSR